MRRTITIVLTPTKAGLLLVGLLIAYGVTCLMGVSFVYLPLRLELESWASFAGKSAATANHALGRTNLFRLVPPADSTKGDRQTLFAESTSLRLWPQIGPRDELFVRVYNARMEFLAHSSATSATVLPE